jgi:general secretion pathway protein G
MKEGRGTRGERRVKSKGLRVPTRPSPLVPYRSRAFTLIELLIVMSIIAMLLTIAVPRYLHSADRAKEAVLKEDLAQMRSAIDKYYGDRGRYPDSLDDLVERKYLRRVPADPITDSVQTWVSVPPAETGKGMVYDVKSGATGTAQDGTHYGDW